MIKTEFWDDEKLATIKRDSRLTFIALWNLSDDYGVVKGNHVWLKNKIYPYDENLKLSEFSVWLSELENICIIIPFQSNSEKYYYIKNFLDHQKINRPSEKRNPEPPDNILEQSLSTHGGLTEGSFPKEKEKEKEKEKDIVVQKTRQSDIPYKKIIDYLNEKANTHFKHNTSETKRLIRARWNQGFDLSAFQYVIDIKCSQWLCDGKMVSYLRPITLFNTKFESYLNESQYED